MLEIKNIAKTFGTHQVLKDMSFTMQPREIAVLLGGSGAGKSTAIRLISNLETPDSGTILLDNKPIQQNQVGMVFQDFNLFPHWSVRDNIVKPLTLAHNLPLNQAIQRAEQQLAAYDLLDKQLYYPHELSGGQKQRAALARTLATKPDVLCLDEPTSALDPVLTKSIAQTVQHLCQKNLYIICATHDIDFVKQLDCTIHYMQNGSILETVSSKQLQEQGHHSKVKTFIQGNAF